jgi:hypothetical protein
MGREIILKERSFLIGTNIRILKKASIMKVEMLWHYCQTRNPVTLGGVENSNFILCQHAQTYTMSEH